MIRRIVSLVAAALVALWVVLGPGITPDAPVVTQAPSASVPPARAAEGARQRVTSPGRGFRSEARLTEHFAKHGQEFPGVSRAEYLALAQALRDAPAGGDVLETVRSADGVISRFDRATGAFLAVDADGTIRTFFKPNDGEAYFRRQANRRPSS